MTRIDIHYALKDMVELDFYLDAPRGTPWFLMSRTGRPAKRKPYKNPVDVSTAEELLRLNLIKTDSGCSYGVSEAGLSFYREHLGPGLP